LQYAELRAPFTGVITDQFQYGGDLGQPTSPIFTLVDLSVVLARAQVPDADVSQIKLGQACQFAETAGRVTVINRAVDQQRRTVEVTCEIAQPPLSLRAGAFGSVTFQTGRRQEAVLVPLSALQLEEGTRKGIALVVDSQGAARRREVEVGDAQGEKRVVLTGLKAGETVVIEGGYELPDGTPVRSGKEPGK
jgi:RND family efflux transporter MFP subunit